MRPIALSFLAMILMGCVLAETPVAQSRDAYFQRNSVKASVENGGNLSVSWVEEGLGDDEVSYRLTAEVVADYYCVADSGGTPNRSKKFTFDGLQRAVASFQPKDGKVKTSLTLNVVSPPSSNPPTCGPGQSLRLQKVEWSTAVLSDTTNVVSHLSLGPFARTLLALD